MLKTRPVGQTATVAAKPAAVASNLVYTATLVRGRVYWYKNHEFHIGVEQVLNDLSPSEFSKLAQELEDLHDETTDAEGEAFEKPLFLVKRDVPRPSHEASHTIVREVRRLPVRPLPRR